MWIAWEEGTSKLDELDKKLGAMDRRLAGHGAQRFRGRAGKEMDCDIWREAEEDWTKQEEIKHPLGTLLLTRKGTGPS